MASCGSEILANQLEDTLTAGKDFNLPPIDFSGDKYEIPDATGPIFDHPDKIGIEDLTTRTVDGAGVFDAIMQASNAHLDKQYQSNRITGQEYAKVYIATIQSAMSTAVQFLLGKDQAYWQSLLVQAQAQAAQVALIQARVEVMTAKLQAYSVQFQALTSEATYALTKLKLATEDQQFCQLKAQTDVTIAQVDMVKEQTEAQRAQTLDTRKDGLAVKGAIGKQKELYSQQITSYQRDAEVKAAKMFTDAWITQKTIDEGLLPPSGFTNTSIDEILRRLKINNGFSTT